MREAVLARVGVEDFRYGKVLDQLLGYERRIENSLYRTMNELRKQRIFGSEYRLQAGSRGAGPRTCPDDMGQPRQERGRPRGAAPTAPKRLAAPDQVRAGSPGRQGHYERGRGRGAFRRNKAK